MIDHIVYQNSFVVDNITSSFQIGYQK